jgi:hypothetical protein
LIFADSGKIHNEFRGANAPYYLSSPQSLVLKLPEEQFQGKIVGESKPNQEVK